MRDVLPERGTIPRGKKRDEASWVKHSAGDEGRMEYDQLDGKLQYDGNSKIIPKGNPRLISSTERDKNLRTRDALSD